VERAAVYVLVAVRELGAGLAGAAVDLFQSPSSNAGDGAGGFQRDPVHRESGGESVISHDVLGFGGVGLGCARELMAGLTG
jgi:hypothetical protein